MHIGHTHHQPALPILPLLPEQAQSPAHASAQSALNRKAAEAGGAPSAPVPPAAPAADPNALDDAPANSVVLKIRTPDAQMLDDGLVYSPRGVMGRGPSGTTPAGDFADEAASAMSQFTAQNHQTFASQAANAMRLFQTGSSDGSHTTPATSQEDGAALNKAFGLQRLATRFNFFA